MKFKIFRHTNWRELKSKDDNKLIWEAPGYTDELLTTIFEMFGHELEFENVNIEQQQRGMSK